MDFLVSLLEWALRITLLGGLTIVIVYAVVRGGSFAYFRTKLEFLKQARNLRR